MISKSRALRTNFGNLNDNFDWKIDGDQMKKNAQSVCLKILKKMNIINTKATKNRSLFFNQNMFGIIKKPHDTKE